MNDPSPLPRVLALHCSGGSGRQWRALAARLDGHAVVLAPDLIGTPGRGPWPGDGPFSLDREAETVLALVDAEPGPVHLVGHSYGGGLALHLAALRPGRVASLSLYEPSAFHLLDRADPARREIRSVVRAVERGVVCGDHRGAARLFVDYWNGEGAFEALRPGAQADLVRYVPKACLDFHALFGGDFALDAFRRIPAPVLVVRGEHAPRPTARIAALLAGAGHPNLSGSVVRGAGHMGPLTHADEVAAVIAGHVRAAPPAYRRAA